MLGFRQSPALLEGERSARREVRMPLMYWLTPPRAHAIRYVRNWAPAPAWSRSTGKCERNGISLTGSSSGMHRFLRSRADPADSDNNLVGRGTRGPRCSRFPSKACMSTTSAPKATNASGRRTAGTTVGWRPQDHVRSEQLRLNQNIKPQEKALGLPRGTA